jgi:hypothetical protein
MEFLPPHEKGLMVRDTMQALRQPEVRINGAGFVLNRCHSAEIMRNCMLLEVLKKLFAKSDLRRPEIVLVGVLRKPNLKTLNRLSLDGVSSGYM